jgi:hypothetical protein
MTRAATAVAVLLLIFTLAGWTGVGGRVRDTGTSRQLPVAVVGNQTGSDIGNGRPQVTYDGLMVRRRTVIALRDRSGLESAALLRDLQRAANRRHTTLSTISASVLDPVVLERLAPDLVLALPAGTTSADAADLVDSPLEDGRRLADRAPRYDIARVLVHDLRFTVPSARPAALAAAITREGILSDALGNYRTTLGNHRLAIGYTGPLLSDHLVQSVRDAIARPAGVAPAAVTVSPRSATGVGVDMTREPVPAPAVIAAAPGHRHSTSHAAGTVGDPIATLPALTPSSRSHPWTDLLAAALVLGMFILLVRLLTMKDTIEPSRDNHQASRPSRHGSDH